MNPNKQENVLKLDAPTRYAYFVRKVTDAQKVWGLDQSGWASAEDDNRKKLFPFWPEKEFAELCATGLWQGYTARAISLDDFLEKWIAGMTRDGVKPIVFPTPSDRGVIVLAADLREAIRAENSQYE